MKLAKDLKTIAHMARADGQRGAAECIGRMVDMVQNGKTSDAKALSESLVEWTLRLASFRDAFDHAVMARDVLKDAS